MRKLYSRTISNQTSEVVDFGILDNRRRRVGVSVLRADALFTELEAGATFGYVKAYGPFAACVTATRNGERFGASQGFEYFDSAEDREAFIAKRIKGTKARYSKLYPQ